MLVVRCRLLLQPIDANGACNSLTKQSDPVSAHDGSAANGTAMDNVKEKQTKSLLTET